MAQWPTDPSWIDPTTINAGNQYNAADGVTATDLDTIIKDLIYLKRHGTATPTGTINITANGVYEIAAYAYANVIVAQPTGTINITSNGSHDVAAYATANVNVPQQQIIQEGIPMKATITRGILISALPPIHAVGGYTITVSATGATYSGPSIIEPGGTASIRFVPISEEYELPDDVTVTGADYYWDSSTGVVSLVDATGPVTVTCICV